MRRTTPNHPQLSSRARSVWAKSRTADSGTGELIGWLPLYQHLDDAAGVAQLLWDEWAPHSIKQLLARTFGSDEAARSLLIWLAGTHDVGKTSPAFAVQVDALASPMTRAGLPISPEIKGSEERRLVRHELVSCLAISAWLHEVHGFSREQADRIASVAAAHHGRPASASDLVSATARPHLVGAGSWEQTRTEFLEWATMFIAPGALESWRTAEIKQPALVLLSGLVIVADWIASSDLFDTAELKADPASITADRVSSAWQRLKFPTPWKAPHVQRDVAALLTERFELPDGAVPHPTQAAFVRRAQELQRPELMILEAEMGSGKTEAALLAAEILAAKFGLSGIFIGLPTQATTDGMFSRMLAWAERLGLETPASVFLARGRSEMNPEYSAKTQDAYFRSIGEDRGQDADPARALVIAHRWFSNPRRGPLSDFVVGTVDQALFAGLRSRYLMLRHLALAGKVVVIDEAHAYDEYMRAFLVRVLEWLGGYGVPVILLSATLPSEYRCAFLEAYDRGRESMASNPPARVDSAPRSLTWTEKTASRAARRAANADRYASVKGLLGYPAITVSNAEGAPSLTTPLNSHPPQKVALNRIDDEPEALIALLRTALRDGGHVAVIRNTVRRAQETAAYLRDAFPEVDLTLAHSRFLAIDRAKKDENLLRRYGRRGERGNKSIVVATQVLEQSLDVDFDLMVTDIAPMDLILQRIGRLHRHDRPDRPSPLRDPRLILTGIDDTGAVPVFEPGSEKIYSRFLLLRTFAALDDREGITVPDDIAPLVELVYGSTVDFVPAQWLDSLEQARRLREDEIRTRTHKAGTFVLGRIRSEPASLLGWLNGSEADPEFTPPGRGTVRDGEETLEVIVLQRDREGTLRTPAWLPAGGGVQIPENGVPSPWLTRIIRGCFLKLPSGMCRGNALDRHIDTLERTFDLPAWHKSHALNGELVLVLDPERRARLNEFELSYSETDGLEYTRDK